MMKKLAFLFVALATVGAYGQISNPPRFIVGTTIVSGLPAAASATNQFWAVTDGASSSDCATGSGTTGVVCWSNGSAWASVGGGGGGSGTVTSFSAGDLAPLFTSSVANPTTTPAHTFTLSAAAANTVFGNFTGGSAVPTFSATPTFAITNLTGTCSTCVANSATLSSPIASPTFTGSPKAPGFFPQTVTAGPSVNIFEQFYGVISNLVGSSNIGSPSGNSCPGATALSDSNHPTYVSAISGTGGAGTGVACRVGTNAGAIFNPNQTPGWIFETDAEPSVLPGTTASSYQAGMVVTPAAEPWTTGIEFRLSSTLGVANDWYCRYGTTDVDSTVAATLAWTRLSIVSDGVNVHWYINGVERCGTGVAIASMPSGAMLMALAATAQSGTSVNFNTGYFLFQRNVTR